MIGDWQAGRLGTLDRNENIDSAPEYSAARKLRLRSKPAPYILGSVLGRKPNNNMKGCPTLMPSGGWRRRFRLLKQILPSLSPPAMPCRVPGKYKLLDEQGRKTPQQAYICLQVRVIKRPIFFNSFINI